MYVHACAGMRVCMCECGTYIVEVLKGLSSSASIATSSVCVCRCVPVCAGVCVHVCWCDTYIVEVLKVVKLSQHLSIAASSVYVCACVCMLVSVCMCVCWCNIHCRGSSDCQARPASQHRVIQVVVLDCLC